MKRVFSLVLSLVMALSIITGMDVSVFAADTEVESYEIYKADRYAETFDDIFVGTDSSSYARNFYNELVNDDLLMGEIVAWESLHLIASPSYSLESGMITKYDYFKTVLFDLIISKSENTIASTAQDNFEYLFDHVKNSKNSFIVSSAKKILSSEDDLTAADLKGMNLTDESKNLLLYGTRFAESAETASDVMQILEWCDNVYDAIELTANYYALTDVYDGTKEVLQYIADDTSNNKDLRLAATACIECMGDSYTEVVNSMTVGAFGLFTDVAGAFIDEAWKSIVATIPGANVALFAIQGGRAIVNLLMSQDDKTKAYYQIEANVICEDAIIRAMSGLKNTYLNNKTEDNAVIYLRAVEMYKDDILLGFDYSIDLLEVLVEANLSTIIGTYNKGIALINDLYSYKSQKLSNFVRLEDAINTAYRNTYMPDYNTVINDYNNQEIVKVESISLELIDEINVGDTGYIGNYIDVIKYPENANDLFVEDFVSLNEDVIKLNEYDFIEVVGTGECTIVCNQGTEFEAAITVTVGETSADDTYDYLNDFEYTVNSDGTTATITGYSDSQSNVIIPSVIDGYVITSIGDYAFYNCTNLISVTIGDSVTSIGDDAFEDCSSLASVTIPDSVTSIGNDAFRGCTSLASITIPDSVTSISYAAFHGCTSLTSVTIPDSVTSIGDDAFEYCSSLASVTIPDSVTSIGDDAFSCCTSLASVTIPDSVTSIGYAAFGDCTSLTSVTIPDSVTSIGSYAFSCCTSLTVITIPDSVTSIGDDAFEYCTSLTSVTIGDSVTSIGNDAFRGCTNLTSVTIGDSVTNIGDDAFEDCSSLASVTIPDSVTSIGNDAFRGCTNLTSVTIGDSVTSIGDDAFEYCSSLASVTIPDSVTSIGSYAFSCCTSLTSITIPDSVTSIGYATFGDCTSLTSVTIPDSVTSIDDYVFAECTSLASVTIPDSVTSIGDGAFASCTSLASVTIPDSVTSIGDDAFGSCYGLKYVFYTGSESDWSNITIGSYNSKLTSSATHYNSTDHNYGDLVTIEPSCENTGKKYYECTVCGCIKEIESMPSLGGHTSSDWIIDTEPTCTKFGSKHKECTVCGEVIETETLLVLDHTSSDWIIDTEPTCTKSGSKHKECTVCGEVIETETLLVLDHTSSEWIVDTEATCKETGSRHKECTVCGKVLENQTIYALGHISSDWIVDSDSGNFKYKECIQCGEVLETVSIDDGGLVFTLNNDGESYSVYGYDEYIRSALVIPSIYKGKNVTSISDFAFKWCYNLETVIIPDSIKVIGEGAFYGCDNLTSLTVGDGVSIIGERAFDCTSLESINVDENNKNYLSIDGVLYTKDKSIIVQYPAGKTDAEYIIPDGVTIIDDYAFVESTNLKNVTIPDTVISISICSFAGCESLTSITIPNSVSSIGDEAFYSCDSLTSISIPNSVTSIGDSAFKYCENLISVTLPNGITSINKNTFTDCISLSAVTIPDSVTSIGYGAFSYCENLTSVTIPDSVLIIDDSAFQNCTNLEIITISDNLTSIGSRAFYKTAFYNNSANWENDVLYLENYLIKARTSIKEDYKIRETTKVIADNAFNDCYSLKTIKIPNSVQFIGEFSFADCMNLKSVTIQENVKSIGDTAFGYYWNISTYLPVDDFLIYGKRGTIAEIYAKENNFKFIDINNVHTHTLSDWIVDENTTCTANGSKHKECTVCGEIIETATIYASGHSEVKDVAVEATCTITGKTEGKHCSVCNAVIVAQTVIPAKGHTADNWIIDTAATVNAAGSQHKECTECGEILETADIPQLKPVIPKLSKVENTASGVKVTWGKVSGADSYIVYRKTYNAKTKAWSGWTRIADGVTATSYVDKTAKSGYYRYTVRAVNEGGTSGYDTNGLKTYFLATPKVTSTANTNSAITVKWGKVTGATGYIVYRKTGNGKWQNLGKTTGTSFTDKTAKAGVTYRYTVRAYYGSYLSSFVANGYAVRRLTTPTLKSVTSSKSGVTFNWNKVTGATGYNVYRKTGNGGWQKIATVKGTSTVKYLDKTAKKGVTYKYTVRAYYGTSTSYYNTKGLTIKDKY